MDEMSPAEREQLTFDLSSDSPERIAAALKTLDQSRQTRLFGALPLPEPGCLEPFGDNVPEEVLRQYFKVVEKYPDFEPLPTRHTRILALVEALVRYDRYNFSLDLAYTIRMEIDHYFVVEIVMNYLRDRDVATAHGKKFVRKLIEHLLSFELTREKMVDTLRVWTMLDVYPDIIEAIRPLLDDLEVARIDHDKA